MVFGSTLKENADHTTVFRSRTVAIRAQTIVVQTLSRMSGRAFTVALYGVLAERLEQAEERLDGAMRADLAAGSGSGSRTRSRSPSHRVVYPRGSVKPFLRRPPADWYGAQRQPGKGTGTGKDAGKVACKGTGGKDARARALASAQAESRRALARAQADKGIGKGTGGKDAGKGQDASEGKGKSSDGIGKVSPFDFE